MILRQRWSSQLRRWVDPSEVDAMVFDATDEIVFVDTDRLAWADGILARALGAARRADGWDR